MCSQKHDVFFWQMDQPSLVGLEPFFFLSYQKRERKHLFEWRHIGVTSFWKKLQTPKFPKTLCHTVPTFHFCPKIICQFCSILYLLKFSILFPNTMHSILLYNYLEWSDCWRYEQWDSSSKNLFLDPLRSDPRFRTTRLIRLAKNPFEEEELASWLRLNRRLPLHWARIGCKLMRRCSDLGLKKKILKLVSLLVKQNK